MTDLTSRLAEARAAKRAAKKAAEAARDEAADVVLMAAEKADAYKTAQDLVDATEAKVTKASVQLFGDPQQQSAPAPAPAPAPEAAPEPAPAAPEPQAPAPTAQATAIAVANNGGDAVVPHRSVRERYGALDGGWKVAAAFIAMFGGLFLGVLLAMWISLDDWVRTQVSDGWGDLYTAGWWIFWILLAGFVLGYIVLLLGERQQQDNAAA